jgi:Flp pilus assembly protein TadD
MKSITLFVALALGTSSFCSTASQDSSHYTLAVIKKSRIYASISNGNYEQALTQLNKVAKQSPDQRFENAMALCTAHIKLGNMTTAGKACDKAVSLFEQAKTYRTDSQKNKYKAFAINNRAIVKHFNNDFDGAYRDFNQAISLSDNRLIITNFNHFSSQMMKKQFGQ